MPACHYPSHDHPPWPAIGPLVVCAGERTCGYCKDAAARTFYDTALQLRQHVRDHHADGGLMDFGGVEVKMCSPYEHRSKMTKGVGSLEKHSSSPTSQSSKLGGSGSEKTIEENEGEGPVEKVASVHHMVSIGRSSQPTSHPHNPHAHPPPAEAQPAENLQIIQWEQTSNRPKFASKVLVAPEPRQRRARKQPASIRPSPITLVHSHPAPNSNHGLEQTRRKFDWRSSAASTIAKYLMRNSANAGKIVPKQAMRKMLAAHDDFVKLCEALERIGLEFDRREIAMLIQRATNETKTVR